MILPPRLRRRAAECASTLGQHPWLLHLVGAALAVFMVFAFAVGVLYPLRLAHRRTLDEIRVTRDLFTAADDLRTRHAKLRTEFTERQLRMDALQKRVPQQHHDAELLVQLNERAQQSGCVIQNFVPGQPVSLPTHQAVEIRVEGMGTYASICQFLNAIESMPRLCHVTRLRVSSGDPRHGQNFEFTLKVFFGLAPAETNSPMEA